MQSNEPFSFSCPFNLLGLRKYDEFPLNTEFLKSTARAALELNGSTGGRFSGHQPSSRSETTDDTESSKETRGAGIFQNVSGSFQVGRRINPEAASSTSSASR